MNKDYLNYLSNKLLFDVKKFIIFQKWYLHFDLIHKIYQLINKNNKCKYLFDSLHFGFVNVLKIILYHGADVNKKIFYFENTALIIAIKSIYCNYEVVKLLIDVCNKNGADVNHKNTFGYTALIFASQYGHYKTVKLLIDNGADVNHKNIYGYTALISASCKGYYKIVKLLLDYGADINHKNNFGNTAYYWAKKYEHFKVVNLLKSKMNEEYFKYLSDKLPFDVKKFVIFHKWYIRYDLIHKIHKLINKNKNKLTEYLFRSSRHGFINVLKITLYNGGVDVNITNFYESTAILLASEYGYYDIVKLLIDCGAEVNHEKYNGCNALIMAAEYEHYEIVKLLINCGANINYEDKFRNTALRSATIAGNYEIIKILLDNGADVNHADQCGRTSLMWSLITYKHYKIIKLLLNNNADPNLKNIFGNDVYYYAKKYNNHRVIDLLKSKIR